MVHGAGARKGAAVNIPAYMRRETSAALLAKSRAFTEPRRAARKVLELLAEFRRIGFDAKAALELAQIQSTIGEKT